MNKMRNVWILIIVLLVVVLGAVGSLLYMRRDDINNAQKIDFTVLQDTNIGKALKDTTMYRFAPELAFDDDYEGMWLVETFYEGDLTTSDFDPYQTDNVFQISQHKVSRMSLIDEVCGKDAPTGSCVTIGKNGEGGDVVKLGDVDGGQAWYGTDMNGTRLNIWADSSEIATDSKILDIYKNMKPVNKFLLGYNQKQYF